MKQRNLWCKGEGVKKSREEEEEFSLGQELSWALPPASGVGHQPLLLPQLSALNDKPLWAENLAIAPIGTLHKTLYNRTWYTSNLQDFCEVGMDDGVGRNDCVAVDADLLPGVVGHTAWEGVGVPLHLH